MSLLERMQYAPRSWEDAMRDRDEMLRALHELVIECECLRASIAAGQRERERLLQRIERMGLSSH
jgi:hypothetical protein